MWTHHTHENLRVIEARHEHLRTLRQHGRLRRARRANHESSESRQRSPGPPPPDTA
jgi:hypothetical protein